MAHFALILWEAVPFLYGAFVKVVYRKQNKKAFKRDVKVYERGI